MRHSVPGCHDSILLGSILWWWPNRDVHTAVTWRLNLVGSFSLDSCGMLAKVVYCVVALRSVTTLPPPISIVIGCTSAHLLALPCMYQQHTHTREHGHLANRSTHNSCWLPFACLAMFEGWHVTACVAQSHACCVYISFRLALNSQLCCAVACSGHIQSLYCLCARSHCSSGPLNTTTAAMHLLVVWLWRVVSCVCCCFWCLLLLLCVHDLCSAPQIALQESSHRSTTMLHHTRLASFDLLPCQSCHFIIF